VACPRPQQLLEPQDVYLHVAGLEGGGGACGGTGWGGGEAAGVAGCLDVLDAARSSDSASFARISFHPPVAWLPRLRVRLADASGAAIDLGGREHLLDLVFCLGGGQLPPSHLR
jgi:hypothetical protein